MKTKVLAKACEMAHNICIENRKRGLRAAHVAFLVKRNKIVEFGFNKKRTHPKTKNYPYFYEKEPHTNLSIHAEFDVVMKYGEKELDKHEMIILRFDGKGKLNNSRPCYGCRFLLKQFGIKSVYYSNSNGDITHELYNH